MNTQKWAWTFGIVLLVVGILGFIPGITTDDGHLLGVFHVDTMHNIVHILSGIIALWTAASSASASRMYFRIFGIIYALVMVAGFIQSGDDMVLGVMANNMADNILHLVIAALALWIGFGMKDNAAT